MFITLCRFNRLNYAASRISKTQNKNKNKLTFSPGVNSHSSGNVVQAKSTTSGKAARMIALSSTYEHATCVCNHSPFRFLLSSILYFFYFFANRKTDLLRATLCTVLARPCAPRLEYEKETSFLNGNSTCALTIPTIASVITVCSLSMRRRSSFLKKKTSIFNICCTFFVHCKRESARV